MCCGNSVRGVEKQSRPTRFICECREIHDRDRCRYRNRLRDRIWGCRCRSCERSRRRQEMICRCREIE